MKFKCGKTYEERMAEYRTPEAEARYKAWIAEREATYRRNQEWADHFAWWPIDIADGDCRWLETVQRRVDCVQSASWPIRWSYREKPAVEAKEAANGPT